MGAFNIKLVLQDMKETIKQQNIELLQKQAMLLLLYFEQNSYSPNEYLKVYLAIHNSLSDLKRKVLRDIINGKKVITVTNNLNIYYDDNISTVVIEVFDDNSTNLLLINIPS